jgi:hypothetical protein
MPNFNLLQSTCLANIITTGLIKYIVAVVGNIAEGIINNYKAKVEVLMEVHFEVIARKSAIFIRSQIASQLGILLISKRRYIISFTRVQEMSEITKSL